ncbi:MAG: hypothetical protein JWP92_2414 [Caulobacter sp.]|nr:hypothetical protein [Caulobacter sp.]
MRVRLTAGLTALMVLTTAAEAAPRTWVRDVVIRTGWRLSPGASETFVDTLREAVDARLAVCAAGRDLRLDLKIDSLHVRRAKDLRPNPSNRLGAEVKVRDGKDLSILDLQRIDVTVPDDGPLLAWVRDPEIVLAEATGDAICAAAFPVG